ncbi:TVP38/TMEM64 family protein [bacterium]|nr:MAG: TVP38/TMEM64 family protein [bacterium]
MKSIKSTWLKALFVLAILGVIFLILRYLKLDFSHITEEEFKNWVKSLGLWGPIIYIAVYILRLLIFFPASILSAAAGVIWGPVWGFLILQIAANISSAVEFLAARYFARGFIESKLKGKIVNLNEKIQRHGFLTVLLIRLIPNVAWDIQNFSLGLTKVRLRDYFLATLIGIMPGSFAVVFFGSSLIKAMFSPKNFWIIIIAILLLIGIFYLQKALRKGKEE